MAKFDYDLLVLGGGSGGLTASKMAVGLGKKVCIVEKNKIGGECTWDGCVPSKALIKAADIVHNCKKGYRYGFTLDKGQTVDSSKVMAFVREKIQAIYSTQTPDVLATFGIDVLIGSPRFIDNHHIMVDGKKVSAKKFIITTGSSPFIPPIDGLENVPYLTNKNIFNLETLPSSLLILGGGAIGAELACALNRLGVKVTIVEMSPTILAKEEQELVDLLQKKLVQDGITIKTSMRASAVALRDGTIELTCTPVSPFSHENDDAQLAFILRADALLIATGRRPNIDGLELEKAGVAVSKRGITVGKTLRTTTKNIYACGDVIGSYLFSHAAWYQAVAATRNAFIPLFKQRVNYDNMLWITFTAPELAAAGLTEQQARERYGSTIKVYKERYNQIDRGVIDAAFNGMGKFICDKKGRLIGAHILGERAGELIHEVQLAKSMGIRFTKIGSVMHAYPAYSDLVWFAAKKARVEALQNNFFVKLYKKLRG